jgi:hypothetical protein
MTVSGQGRRLLSSAATRPRARTGGIRRPGSYGPVAPSASRAGADHGERWRHPVRSGASDWQHIREFLTDRGAHELAHPGGTLYEHLVRVADLLAAWGADIDLRAAGLCHACYGTDGYAHTLLALSERRVLADLIGRRAESLVYLYASCDRDVAYPALETSGPVSFRDRFTGQMLTLSEAEVRPFIELTAANELDVIRHSPAAAAQHSTALRRLFSRARPRLTEAAWQAWDQQASTDRPAAAEPRP